MASTGKLKVHERYVKDIQHTRLPKPDRHKRSDAIGITMEIQLFPHTPPSWV
jgi:hypothetical protein